MAFLGNQPKYSTYQPYYLSGDGSKTSFTLAEVPASASTVLLHINGIKQHVNSYIINGNLIVFSEPPPKGVNNIEYIFLASRGQANSVADGAITTSKLGAASVTGDKLDAPVTALTSSSTLTVGTALQTTFIIQTTHGQTHTLPLAATFPPGGKIVFHSRTIGNTIVPQGGNNIFLGNNNLSSIAVNEGTIVELTTNSTNWYAKIIPSPGFLHNYTDADITLNVGEQCYYDVSAATSLALKVATETNQEYEIVMRSNYVGVASTAAHALQMNNTTYGTTITVIQLWGSTINTSSANTTTTGVFRLGFGATGSVIGFTARINTRTNGKQIWVENYSRDSSAAYMFLSHSVSSDTTTEWTSLGTLTFGTDTPTARITVRRIS